MQNSHPNATPAGYTLDAGRVIVAPSGVRLVALQRVAIPESEHPDRVRGAHTLSGPEADRFARQIVAALNADPSRPDVRPAPALADAARALQSHLTAKAQQSAAFRDWLAEDGGREAMQALAAALDAPAAVQAPAMESAARQLGFKVQEIGPGGAAAYWIACEPNGLRSRFDYASEADAWKACAVKVTGAPWPHPDALAATLDASGAVQAPATRPPSAMFKRGEADARAGRAYDPPPLERETDRADYVDGWKAGRAAKGL